MLAGVGEDKEMRNRVGVLKRSYPVVSNVTCFPPLLSFAIQ